MLIYYFYVYLLENGIGRFDIRISEEINYIVIC